MESSQSTDKTQIKFEIDRYKVALYYNKYRYRVKFKIKGVHFFRYCKTVFDVNERLQESVNRGYIRTRGSVLNYVHEFVDSVHAFVDWRTHRRPEGLVSVSADTVNFYTSDLESVQELQAKVLDEVLTHTDRVVYTEAVPIENRVDGAIYRRRPRSQWRMHFNWGKLTETEVTELRNTLDNYRVVLNPRLNWSLYSHGRVNAHGIPSNKTLYLRTSDYIEYDDEDLTLILTLILGSHVRSVHPVVKLPDRTK